MSLSITKRCRSCGKEFQPRDPRHDLCQDCFRSTRGPARGSGGSRRGQERYDQASDERVQWSKEKHELPDFYTPSGAIRREVYMETAEEIAQLFNRVRDPELKAASVRRFFESVRAAYDRYTQHPERSFESAMELIYRLRPLARKSEERKVTHPCFTKFMEYYIELTSKDRRNLKGFKELFMSVIGYMKK